MYNSSGDNSVLQGIGNESQRVQRETLRDATDTGRHEGEESGRYHATTYGSDRIEAFSRLSTTDTLQSNNRDPSRQFLVILNMQIDQYLNSSSETSARQPVHINSRTSSVKPKHKNSLLAELHVWSASASETDSVTDVVTRTQGSTGLNTGLNRAVTATETVLYPDQNPFKMHYSSGDNSVPQGIGNESQRVQRETLRDATDTGRHEGEESGRYHAITYGSDKIEAFSRLSTTDTLQSNNRDPSRRFLVILKMQIDQYLNSSSETSARQPVHINSRTSSVKLKHKNSLLAELHVRSTSASETDSVSDVVTRTQGSSSSRAQSQLIRTNDRNESVRERHIAKNESLKNLPLTENFKCNNSNVQNKLPNTKSKAKKSLSLVVSPKNKSPPFAELLLNVSEKHPLHEETVFRNMRMPVQSIHLNSDEMDTGLSQYSSQAHDGFRTKSAQPRIENELQRGQYEKFRAAKDTGFVEVLERERHQVTAYDSSLIESFSRMSAPGSSRSNRNTSSQHDGSKYQTQQDVDFEDEIEESQVRQSSYVENKSPEAVLETKKSHRLVVNQKIKNPLLAELLRTSVSQNDPATLTAARKRKLSVAAESINTDSDESDATLTSRYYSQTHDVSEKNSAQQRIEDELQRVQYYIHQAKRIPVANPDQAPKISHRGKELFIEHDIVPVLKSAKNDTRSQATHAANATDILRAPCSRLAANRTINDDLTQEVEKTKDFISHSNPFKCIEANKTSGFASHRTKTFRADDTTLSLDVLNNEIYVTLTTGKNTLHVFHSVTYEKRSPIVVTGHGLKQSSLRLIAACRTNKCLYVSDFSNKLVLQLKNLESTVCNASIWFQEYVDSVSVTSTGNVLLAQRMSIIINAFDGTLLRSILINDVGLLNHAVETSTGSFIVCTGGTTENRHRVCEVSKEGVLLRAFGTHAGVEVGMLCRPLHLALDGNDNVFVADYDNYRVLILNFSDFSVHSIIFMGRKPYKGRPRCLCYQQDTGLIVCGIDHKDENGIMRGRIDVWMSGIDMSNLHCANEAKRASALVEKKDLDQQGHARLSERQ